MKTGKTEDLDDGVIDGFIQIAQAFRLLLSEQARKHDLSPLQVQLLIHLQQEGEVRVSSLAQHFGLTKATISEAVKSLESKNIIGKHKDQADARSYAIRLTEWGANIAHIASFYTEPLRRIIAPVAVQEKEILLKNIKGILRKLQPGQA
jgi:DNA-binding MarR family transcriptional regulator